MNQQKDNTMNVNCCEFCKEDACEPPCQGCCNTECECHPAPKDTPPVKEDWHEEFEKEFVDRSFNEPDGDYGWTTKAHPAGIKAFISKVETESYKRGREDEAIDHVKEDVKVIETIIGIVEVLHDKGSFDIPPDTAEGYSQQAAHELYEMDERAKIYNQALSDFKQKLTSTLGK